MSDTADDGRAFPRTAWLTAAKLLCTLFTSRTAKLSSWSTKASMGRRSVGRPPVGDSVRLAPLFRAFHKVKMDKTSECQSPSNCFALVPTPSSVREKHATVYVFVSGVTCAVRRILLREGGLTKSCHRTLK